MATFFKIIMLIAKYGPTIWALVGEIIKLINGVSAYMESSEREEFRAAKRSDLDTAVNYYRITRDKTRLRELHGELSVQLENVKSRGLV